VAAYRSQKQSAGHSFPTLTRFATGSEEVRTEYPDGDDCGRSPNGEGRWVAQIGSVDFTETGRRSVNARGVFPRATMNEVRNGKMSCKKTFDGMRERLTQLTADQMSIPVRVGGLQLGGSAASFTRARGVPGR